MRVGKIPECGCGKTKNPPYCDGSHYEPPSGLQATIPPASPKKQAPVVQKLETNCSQEVKDWNSAIEKRKTAKRQR